MKLMRFSGRPVLLENLEAFEAEFKQEFDKIAANVGADMPAFADQLKVLDESLKLKYRFTEDLGMPKSAKAWSKLMDHYGCPIMFARSAEKSTEIVAVLMDEGVSGGN